MTSYRLAKVAVVAAAIAVGSLVLPSRAEAGSGPFWQFSSPHKCEFHTPGVDIGDPIDAVVGETWYTHDDVTVNTAGSSWPFRRAYAALEGFRHCDTQDSCSDIRIPVLRAN